MQGVNGHSSLFISAIYFLTYLFFLAHGLKFNFIQNRRRRIKAIEQANNWLKSFAALTGTG